MTQSEKKINYYGIMGAVSFAFFFLMHLTFVAHFNDELYFMEYSKGFSSLLEIIIDRYKTDSSRVISEFILFFLLEKPFIIWQVLDTLICLLTYHSLTVLLVNDKYSKMNIIVFMIFASYIYMHVGSAGWICTSLNYIWPLATLLYASSIAMRRYRGEIVKPWQYVLGIIAMIFTANTEMSSTSLMMIFGMVAVYALMDHKKNKRSFWYELTGFILGVAGIIFALASPGNGARTEMEAGGWMPEFFDLTIVDKFRLCSVFVFEHFIVFPDILFILFAALIAFVGVKKGNKLWKNVVSLLPAITAVVYTGVYFVIYIVKVVTDLSDGHLDMRIAYDFTTPSIYVTDAGIAFVQYSELVGMYLFIISAVVAIWNIFPDVRKRITCIWALGTGFAVRMALMLSPTMFSSWHRTLIFMYFGFIYVSMELMKILMEVKNQDNKKWQKIIVMMLLVFGIIINLFLTVASQLRK